MGLLFGDKEGTSRNAGSRRVASLVLDAVVILVIGLCIILLINRSKTTPDKEKTPAESVVSADRPSMGLGEPEVIQFSQPQPSEQITTSVPDEEMPDFRLPGIADTGAGLLRGVAEDSGIQRAIRDLFTEPTENLFGRTDRHGDELEVTYYNFDRTSDGAYSIISQPEYFSYLRDLVDSGWQTEKLDRFYQSPEKRYATTIAIPHGTSLTGPLSFGAPVEDTRFWAAHYRGKIVHNEGIMFRFWGSSEGVLAVAVDRDLVLVANEPNADMDAYTVGLSWNRRAERSRSMLYNNGPYKCGSNSLVGGQWITLEPGVPHDFDVLVGSGPGPDYFAMLMVEVRYEIYSLNDWGGPIFPLFAIEPPSRDLEDMILMNMYEGEANATNITTFFSSY